MPSGSWRSASGCTPSFVQSAMIVVRHLGLCGQYHDAILLARHALRFDPYSRGAGSPSCWPCSRSTSGGSIAIRYYDHWIGMIQKELGISPLPATRAIVDEIRNLHNAENAQHLRVRLMSRDERQAPGALSAAACPENCQPSPQARIDPAGETLSCRRDAVLTSRRCLAGRVVVILP